MYPRWSAALAMLCDHVQAAADGQIATRVKIIPRSEDCSQPSTCCFQFALFCHFSAALLTFKNLQSKTVHYCTAFQSLKSSKLFIPSLSLPQGPRCLMQSDIALQEARHPVHGVRMHRLCHSTWSTVRSPLVEVPQMATGWGRLCCC